MAAKVGVPTREEIWQGCTRYLAGHGVPTARQTLEALAAAASNAERPDHYGVGEIVSSLESRIADLLGKEAALFFPTGTMAQQIALRLWCERAARPVVAFHPTCHLEIHEQHAYQVMHGLRAQLVGRRHDVITLEDLQGMDERPAALLLELPQREIGGKLPEWDDLQAQLTWARERSIRNHMDGARLWESGPYYRRPYAEIAAAFDSVYVSFYKGLGALGGAALAGPGDFIAEARVWQRRHGGNLYRFYPYALSAGAALDARLDLFPAYHERAVAVASVIASIPGIRVTPNPPQSNMMHVYLSGDRDLLVEASVQIAQEEGVGLFPMLRASDVPGESMFELSIGDCASQLSDDEIREYFSRIVAAGATNGPRE